MVVEVSLHPSRFVGGTSSGRSTPTTDAVVDQWLTDHFHGPHHMRALADPYDYICRTAQELKRRLATKEI